MATRNRIIYQSQAVALLGDSTADTITTLNGVQSVTYGIEVGREDVNHFGALGAIDRIIMEAPTATQEVQFHYPNGMLTGILGAVVTGALGSATNGLIIALDADVGQDYNSVNSTANAVKLEGGRLSSFSLEMSVGAIPTITLGFEGTGLSYAAQTVPVPSDYSVSLGTFADVVVTLANGSTSHMAHAQSATLSFDLGSEALQQLGGGGLSYDRVPTFPATASLEVEGLAPDRGMSLTLAGIATKASGGGSNTDAGGRANVSISTGSANTHLKFELVNATLDSVSYNNAIGDNATCSATFSVSIGGTASSSTLRIIPNS